jgi:TolB-like protein/tetratricopeptide (TPR) repeat protein
MAHETEDLRGRPSETSPGTRLDSWKEVAAYLKCSERTVRRWEHEGLPVYRHPHKKKAGIYAYRSEIDAWWRDGHDHLKQIEAVAEPIGGDPEARTRTPFWRQPRRWIALGLAVLAVGAVGLLAGRWRERFSSKAAFAPIHSVAVLPLDNLSHDPEQQYFADGMTDALITDIAKIHALRVISRNSIMQYKGNPKPVRQIAQELNVDAVVEGTVLRSGDRVRITAQLIDAPKDRHLWAETYEGNLRDVLSLQDEVAKAVAGQVRIQLSPQEQTRLSNARQVDPVAHQSYLRGIYELHGPTDVSREKAILYFQAALARDPNDALAYAGLARAYSSLSAHYQAPTDVMPRARAAALKAVELDDTVAEAHASLGFINLVFDWNWPGAEREFRTALELNPNSAVAHAQYAEYLLLVPHRVDEGIREFRRAYDLDPLVPQGHGDLVWFLFESRRYSEAIEQAAKELDDDSPFLSLSYAELGRRDEALVAADRAAKNATAPILMAQTASAYAMAGNTKRSHELLATIMKQAGKRYVCGVNMGAVYSVLGEKDQAFAWLERGYRDRST